MYYYKFICVIRNKINVIFYAKEKDLKIFYPIKFSKKFNKSTLKKNLLLKYYRGKKIKMDALINYTGLVLVGTLILLVVVYK
jgi:hypothetical protein